jgi:hypothetical protein
LELGVSKNGQTVVVGTGNNLLTSLDSGATVLSPGVNVKGTFGWATKGDPSIAVGATDTFYAAYIGIPPGGAAAGGVNGCATDLLSAPDGLTFGFNSHAFVCPLNGVDPGPPFEAFGLKGFCFPDQHHIAADRARCRASTAAPTASPITASQSTTHSATTSPWPTPGPRRASTRASSCRTPTTAARRGRASTA